MSAATCQRLSDTVTVCSSTTVRSTTVTTVQEPAWTDIVRAVSSLTATVALLLILAVVVAAAIMAATREHRKH